MARQQKALDYSSRLGEIKDTADGILCKEIPLAVGKNPAFSARDTFNNFFMASVRNSYVETVVREMRLLDAVSTMNSTPGIVQSPDTALRRMKKTKQGELIDGMGRAIRGLTIRGKGARAFDKPMECAVDIHNVLRFTKIKRMEHRKRECDDMPKAVGIDETDGAHFAHMYMTIEGVNTDYRYTFDFEPVFPLTDRPMAFDKLLSTTKFILGNKLWRIYGDGGFCGV